MKSSFVRISLTIIIGVSCCGYAAAQSFANNALLFGRTNIYGSSRVQALGGAQVSLGGDYSSALSNPAGLGMYNRSEFTISPGVTSLDVKSNYLGNSSSDSKSTFNIPGLSLAIHKPNGKETGILGGTFGITLTRINDLNATYNYSGLSTGSSLIDYFVDQAAGIDPDDMLFEGPDFYNITALGYNNYLIDVDPDSAPNFTYLSPLDPLNGEVRTLNQGESMKRRGAQYQWSIAYGANLSDKFFFGGSLGITTLRYKLTQTFYESGFSFSEDPAYNPLNNYSLEETYDLKGNGLNFTLGAIYRPIDMIQIGVSYVTPTYYEITDTYNATLYSQWNNFDYYSDGSTILDDVSQGFEDPLISKYSFRTPGKITAGISILTPFGFLTADVDYLNYSNSRYRASDISFGYDNDEIKSIYTSVFNYRVGVEGRFKIFRARLGYNYMADPYTNVQGIDRSITTFSGGLGVRKDNFFVDLTYATSQTDDKRVPYSANGYADNVANFQLTRTNIMATVGFTF